jgi:16S rRNA processing protein RimM
MKNDLLCVAQIGKSVALSGENKLNIYSDFTEQFKKDSIFFDKDNNEFEIERFNLSRKVVKFKNISNVQEATKITNKKLYQNIQDTREKCILKKDEFFYFDILDCEIVEKDTILGKISDIDRFSNKDYFLIKTDVLLVEEGFSKSFLIPYDDFYIVDVDIEQKVINVQNSMEILKES